MGILLFSVISGFERDLGELWNNRGSLEQLEMSKVEEFEAKRESLPSLPPARFILAAVRISQYINPRRSHHGEIHARRRRALPRSPIDKPETSSPRRDLSSTPT